MLKNSITLKIKRAKINIKFTFEIQLSSISNSFKIMICNTINLTEKKNTI